MRSILLIAVLLSASLTGAWDASGFKKPSRAELKKKLTPMQFEVTQDEGTEKPFKNAFWNLHEDGIYVDVVSGEPLFSSKDKYDSGTGWPSFTKPLDSKYIVLKKELLGFRTEVISKHASSHLGHVFDDGPKPTGQRYCMNSEAMRFIRAKDLVNEGYAEFAPLFEEAIKSNPSKSEGGKSEATAVFAGGCFWCMEPPFEKLDGVHSVISGYSGGNKKNPTYEEVSAGKTGHLEVVKVTYDPNKINYEKLLSVFWRQIDPTDAGGQFVDRGESYKSAIFYADDAQKLAAEKSKVELEKSKRFAKSIVTEIRPAKEFYAAEEYHQDYYKNNPVRYKYYRYQSGRDQFLEKTWKKSEDNVLTSR